MSTATQPKAFIGGLGGTDESEYVANARKMLVKAALGVTSVRQFGWCEEYLGEIQQGTEFYKKLSNGQDQDKLASTGKFPSPFENWKIYKDIKEKMGEDEMPQFYQDVTDVYNRLQAITNDLPLPEDYFQATERKLLDLIVMLE